MLDFTGSKIFEDITHHIFGNRSRNMGQYMGQSPNTQMGLSHLTSEIVPLNCPIFRIYSETVPPLTRAILEHLMGQMGQLGQFTGNFWKERRKYIGKGFRGGLEVYFLL